MQPFAHFDQRYENKVLEYYVEKESGFFSNSRMNHVNLILYQWTFPDWKKSRSEVFSKTTYFDPSERTSPYFPVITCLRIPHSDPNEYLL